jgi:hypothetical protein
LSKIPFPVPDAALLAILMHRPTGAPAWPALMGLGNGTTRRWITVM